MKKQHSTEDKLFKTSLKVTALEKEVVGLKSQRDKLLKIISNEADNKSKLQAKLDEIDELIESNLKANTNGKIK